MPDKLSRPLSHAEDMRLDQFGLKAEYQKRRRWFIDVSRAVVQPFISMRNGPPSSPPITADEMADIVSIELRRLADWHSILAGKPHIPYNEYDILRDSMARFVVEDAYWEIRNP